MRSPANAMLPPSGANTPAIMLNSVVLPAPFGPITAKIAPCGTSKLTLVDREQAAEPLADAVDRKKRAHFGFPVSPRRRQSHGHTPSGSAMITSSRQMP